ncbi:MAG: hypothetical protein WC087_00810 [Candidatus Paceibacterota bacterium]
MSKKKIIISIIFLAILGFVLNNIFNQPEEFQVEDVMIDRGSGEF